MLKICLCLLTTSTQRNIGFADMSADSGYISVLQLSVLDIGIFLPSAHLYFNQVLSWINTLNVGFKPDKSLGAEGPKGLIWLKASVLSICLILHY